MSTKTKRSKQGSKPKTKIDYTSPARLQKIFTALDGLFPHAECALHHKNAFQLLVATILSAQCTDERVNKVTPELFRKYPTPRDYVGLPQEDLEREIHSTGFFRNKAKNIIAASTKIVQDYGGEVPRTMEELLTLPGVARKTANVVLGTAFGIASGVVVDTHVFRITHRLKLTNEKTPEKVEQDLMKLVPQNRWVSFSHQLILFGRKICVARNPLCGECPLASICDSPDKTIGPE
ncbi:MAG TPA: endonuclease III [Terriglobia bacterium]|nr:endonuclease III [Terriglobia bacterium]